MTKFLLISQDAGSPHHGMVIRNYNWAKTLVEQGHEVTILTSAYTHSRNVNPTVKGIKSSVEHIDGIEYRWVSALRYNPKNKLFRLFSTFFFVFQLYLYKLFAKEQYDVVICSCPVPFQLYPAVSIAKKMSAKFVFDIRDLWPLTPIHLGGYSEKHPLIKVMAHAQSYALKKSDLVTAVAQGFQDYLAGQGMNKQKFLALNNGIMLANEKSRTNEIQEHEKEIKELRAGSEIVIGYAGAIGIANSLDSFVKAVAKSPDNVSGVIVGKGAEKENIKQLINDLNISNRFKVLPSIPANQVPNFLSFVDAGYCGLLNKPLFEYGVSPTKLNDFMIAKKPIIYAIGNKDNIIGQCGCGFSAIPENIKSITDAITSFSVLNQDKRQEMGQKGYNWAMENSLVSKQMKVLVERLDQLN